jgi:hypothetical protein
MPAARAAGAKGREPGPGIVGWVAVLLVVLAVAGGGFYYWSRVQAVNTAKSFIEAYFDMLTSGQAGLTKLKALLVKDEAAEVSQLERVLPSGGAAAGMGGALKHTTQVKGSKVGLNSATVNMAVSLEAMGYSLSQDVNVILVREGLTWKVNGKKTGEASKPPTMGKAK